MRLETPEEVAEAFNVSRESLAHLRTYADLLIEWQSRINLVGPATIPSLWSRHIADSLQLLPLMTAADRSLADLGSGAGLPGLVLSIAGGVPADLYESNGKKAAFLREAARLTQAPAQVRAVRLESLAEQPFPRAPRYVTARALAPLSQLLAWASPFLLRGSTGLFHKGQDVDNELTEAGKSWRMDVHKHPSLVDSRGTILEVKELARV
jgi:16S rRNA (guanine527-N7)-methyltransferase